MTILMAAHVWMQNASLEMDAKQLAIISTQILQMLWPPRWHNVYLCKIFPLKMACYTY